MDNKDKSEYLRQNYGNAYSELSEEERIAMIQRNRQRQRRAEQRKRDRMEAYAVMIIFAIIVIWAIVHFASSGSKSEEVTVSSPKSETVSSASTEKSATNSSGSSSKEKNKTSSEKSDEAEEHDIEVIDGITYVDGIMIVNKTYSVPESYAPGLSSELSEAFEEMASDAYEEGIVLFICSGYRSYSEQETLYNGYASERGTEAADEVSSRAGHSEHQTGLCVDVNSTEFSFGDTAEAEWLAEHCAEYGFIIRFPDGKEDITGYTYEPWHIRYVGIETAKEITEQGVCLEEYLGVTSTYENAEN